MQAQSSLESCGLDKDEFDPIGRVRKFAAHGFIAFYSSLPSSSLGRTFERLKADAPIEMFDVARIEHELLTNPALKVVFKRYFPRSYKSWEHERIAPFPIVSAYEPLPCSVCGKDMLVDEEKIGNIVLLYTRIQDLERVVTVYPCCKTCDRLAAAKFRKPGLVDRWIDLADAAIPRRFFEIVFGLMNELDMKKVTYDPAALKQYKQIILRIAQVVVRETSPQQRRRLSDLAEFPF